MGWRYRQIFLSLIFIFQHANLGNGKTDVPTLGHMLPLGSHANPVDVEERSDFPSAQEFMDRYVLPSKPVVFRGVLKGSPMLETWTDEYISKTYPNLEVRLEAKTEKEGYVPIGDVGMGRDTLKNFIDTYHKTNKYVVSELPTPAWHEVHVPSFMTCGPVLKNFVEIDLWMSGGNTSSLLHKDAFNALNCLFNGTKEWKLFEYKYEKELYKAYEPGSPLGGFSRINPEAVDMLKYPKIATVPWSFTTVHKGDCLFLPKSMYHQVKSYGTMNTAIALLFSRFDHIKKNKTFYGDCPSKAFPLKEIDVELQYSGKGPMSMGHSELNHVRGQLLKLVGESQEATIRNILQEVSLKDGNPVPSKEKAEKVLKILQNGKPDKKITRESIKRLPRSAVREATFLVEPFIPSNNYEYEYFQISPTEIAELLGILAKEGNGIIKRADFVKQYEERLWGSEKFANSFFDDLAGKNANEVDKKGLLETFHTAAKKFDKKEFGQGDEDDDDGVADEEKTDDAYLGRTLDLDTEKDGETLQNLGKQIFEGGFVDITRDFEAGNKADLEGEDEEDREDEGKGEDAAKDEQESDPKEEEIVLHEAEENLQTLKKPSSNDMTKDEL